MGGLYISNMQETCKAHSCWEAWVLDIHPQVCTCGVQVLCPSRSAIISATRGEGLLTWPLGLVSTHESNSFQIQIGGLSKWDKAHTLLLLTPTSGSEGFWPKVRHHWDAHTKLQEVRSHGLGKNGGEKAKSL